MALGATRMTGPPPALDSTVLSGDSHEVVRWVTELRTIPEGWWAVGGLALAVALVWAVAWMYRHEGRSGVSKRTRVSAAVLRSAVILTLVGIWLEPVRVRIVRRSTDSYALVLIDDSSSMGLTDRYALPAAAEHVKRYLGTDSITPIRRTDLLRRLVESDRSELLRGLARRNRVKVFTFDDDAELVGVLPAEREEGGVHRVGDGDAGAAAERFAPSFEAMGASTNIERAVHRAWQSAGGAPIAGVVVLTDGGFNDGASVEEVARWARENRLAIHTVGIGDPSPARNVRLLEVEAPRSVFREDPFTIRVRAAAEGMAGETLAIRLLVRSATGGDARILETRRGTVQPDGSVSDPTAPLGVLAFEHRQQRAGRQIYTVEVPVDPLESVVEDNTRQVTVNVVESRTRVLLVSSGPSWDYRFVSRLFERDNTCDVSCWLQSADGSAVRDGDTVIDHLPVRPEELYAYDVIILMDVDPSELDGNWCRVVDTLVVDRGGGLLFVAGRVHTSEFLRTRSLDPLVDLLPIAPDPEVELSLNRIGHYQLVPAPIEVPKEARNHPVLQAPDGEDAGRVTDLDAPRYTALPRAAGEAGGHSADASRASGHAQRARWTRARCRSVRRGGPDRVPCPRRHVAMEAARRRAVQRLLDTTAAIPGRRQAAGGANHGAIQTHGEEYALGHAVDVTARLFDARLEPLRRDRVEASYLVDGVRRVFTLEAQGGKPGWFTGRFVPDRTGLYELSVTRPDAGGARAEPITHEIRVVRPNVEIARPRMARDDLRRLAEQSGGGRYFEVDEAGALPDLIPDLHEEISVRSRPIPLWDNGRVLAWLAGLLCVEWIIRKWGRLL